MCPRIIRLTGEQPEEILRALSEIERECFSHPLTVEQLSALLRDPAVLFLAAEAEGEFPGSVWVQTVLNEGYIGNVAVRCRARRRGVADSLLSRLEETAAGQGLSFLTLEVRSGNDPALRLYEKHGYARVGLRPGYYSDPKEDAVLMTKWLTETI